MEPTITSYFDGDVVEELMMLAVTQNEIVDQGIVHIEDNIQYKRTVTKVRQSNIIQDIAATPTSQGSIDFTDEQLQPDPFMVYIEFDPNEFRQLWEPYHPKGEFVFTELNPSVQRELLELLLKGEGGVDNYLGNAIINGDNITPAAAPLNKFTGIIKRMVDNPDVIDVSGAATITASNIIEKLTDGFNAARVPVRNNPDFAFVISEPDYQKYTDALRDLANKSIDPSEAAPMRFRSKQMYVLSDLPENTYFTTICSPERKGNLWVGVRGTADQTTIKVAPVQNNSDLWFFKMKMAVDAKIKWGQDVTLYQP